MRKLLFFLSYKAKKRAFSNKMTFLNQYINNLEESKARTKYEYEWAIIELDNEIKMLKDAKKIAFSNHIDFLNSRKP